MEGLKTTDKKDSQKQPAKADVEPQKPTEPEAKGDLALQKSTETHRYHLAMLFIVGFIIIMGIALLGTIFWGYTGIANLVGFFSGSVAAVIGYYFLQQNTAGAQAQAKTATDSAVQAGARALEVEQKNRKSLFETGSLVVEALDVVAKLQEQLPPTKGPGLAPSAVSLSAEVKDKLEKARDTIKRYSTS